MTTTTSTDGLTEHEAWLIVIADILDATASMLDQLEPVTRDQITRVLAREIPGYTDSDDLARRAHAAVQYLDHEN